MLLPHSVKLSLVEFAANSLFEPIPLKKSLISGGLFGASV